jgi:predicted AAA+ superfamily ATPase
MLQTIKQLINVLNVITINVMDVNTRNKYFAEGKYEFENLWPKITEVEGQYLQFRQNFGLTEIPHEPGVIVIRGPRQYGKSTWLEYSMRDSIEEFGKGSTYYLNGDEISHHQELQEKIEELLPLFHPKAKVKRLFIDEISTINKWELAIKKIADQGRLKDILIITTGSRSTDLRRGVERLPGRKGKLKRTQYFFTGVAFKDLFAQRQRNNEDTHLWISYLLSGSSPIAANEIMQFEHIPTYFYEIVRDWVFGEITRTGRSRQFLISIMRTLHKKGCARLGYLNLAKDSGLANNTIASEYIEQLSDLLSVIPQFQWDADKEVPLQKKPCKFLFINLSVALAFAPEKLHSVFDFNELANEEKSKWLEWLVGQEIFRRQCIKNVENPETIYYWQSENHEIDFVDANGTFYEVKLGKTSLIEFAWFSKIHPKRKLIVISQSEFQGKNIKGVTIEQFLLADGLPHPYPGMVDDVDIYNDLLRF